MNEALGCWVVGMRGMKRAAQVLDEASQQDTVGMHMVQVAVTDGGTSESMESEEDKEEGRQRMEGRGDDSQRT